ncbi:hypothetical protein I350_01261 [Cryptococcus amylolentus CBS 6273]|uniref:Uncharacterized protein n=1 Tax=Cryptococcus amylolentus CBS 6273 TaxID=1296118 RepID=A0A1E3KC48_9TREE|nr:hypothetical protein I350_01261 [Cryptococcus amylolentus CBS 6273]
MGIPRPVFEGWLGLKVGLVWFPTLIEGGQGKPLNSPFIRLHYRRLGHGAGSLQRLIMAAVSLEQAKVLGSDGRMSDYVGHRTGDRRAAIVTGDGELGGVGK